MRFLSRPFPRPVLQAFTISAFIAAFAFAACGDDDANGNTPTLPTATSEDGGGETPSPDAGPTEDGSAQLPTNAEAYAAATFEAWLDGDRDMLEQLVSAAAMTSLEANAPTDPDTWAANSCDAATGQVACEFESTTGDTLTLLIDNAMASAGEPEAVIEAQFS